MHTTFQKILSVLRVRSVVAGLDISDEVVRLAYFNGKFWQMHAIRLLPGVMEGGRIKNREAFLASLVELKIKSGIAGRDGKKKANVVVSLSSANPYSKVFTLPTIEGDELEKAIALNLEMLSPSDKNQMYSGAEVVNRDAATGTMEILSSFIEQGIVDGVVDVLFAGGFTVVAIESKALSLTRVLREKGAAIDKKKAYLFVAVDSAGVEFLIVKNSVPYFEYNNRWSDLAGEKGEVPVDVFKKELADSLRQVLNFYAQQWPEPLAEVILSAVAFRTEIESAIVANAGVPAARLTLEMGQPISSEWLAALGACLRGSVAPLGGKEEISFLGEESRDRFHEEQALVFFGFWQVIIPVVFGVLIIFFIVANSFLDRARVAIESGAGFASIPGASSSIAEYEASSTEFNNEVALIQLAENAKDPSVAIIGELQTMAFASGVTISKLSYLGPGTPLSLSGIASTEDQISTFKDSLQNNTHVSGVNLPLTGIQPAGTGYSFTVSFNYQ